MFTVPLAPCATAPASAVPWVPFPWACQPCPSAPWAHYPWASRRRALKNTSKDPWMLSWYGHGCSGGKSRKKTPRCIIRRFRRDWVSFSKPLYWSMLPYFCTRLLRRVMVLGCVYECAYIMLLYLAVAVAKTVERIGDVSQYNIFFSS